MNIGLYQSASSLTALERWQDVVSQNITSSQTTAYRKRTVQFSTQSAGHWNVQTGGKGNETQHPALFAKATNGINFINGETQPTRREFDLALQGEGFFEVQREDGMKLYTRSGEFSVRADRTVVSGNATVMTEGGNPLQLLPDGGTVAIDANGTVSQNGAVIGKLSIQQFADNAALLPAGNGTFIAGPNARMETAENPGVLQGYLEQSNVQSLREMVDLVLISRAYEANQKIITTIDQQLEKTLEALG